MSFSNRGYSVSGDSIELLEERDSLRHALRVVTDDSLELLGKYDALINKYNSLLDILSQKTAEIHSLRDDNNRLRGQLDVLTREAK